MTNIANQHRKTTRTVGSYKYKNIAIFLLSLVVAFFLYRYEPFHRVLLSFGEWGYIGAFIGGILFVSTFTVATGMLILLILVERLSPLEIGIIAGLGAVVGDITIFKFVKDGLVDEIKEIYSHTHIRSDQVSKILHSRYFSWTIPVIGALIIASPLPDEIGVSLMGIAKMKTYQFLLLSFLLNAIGIFAVVSASTVVKP